MKAKNLCVYAGLCAGVASMAAGQVQKTGDLKETAGQKIDPVRVANVAMQDGKIVFQSDWMDYTGGNSRATNVRIFDCFGDDDSEGTPDGGVACGLGGETSRWYFGSAYCNMFFTNDMTVHADTVIADGASQMDIAWFWTAGGSGTSEACIIAAFTQDSAPCDPDSFDYSGWLLDFGTLASGVGQGYYYSNVAISSGAWALPTGGTGSYFLFFLQAITSSGAWVLATCAQPMLWGTGDARGNPAAPGTQTALEFDDDAVIDGSHSSSECYSYSYSSLCPNILGGMGQFWGNTDEGGDPCLEQFPNCDGNGVVNTQDFLCFLGKWSAAFQSGNYDAAADCDGNGSINTQDFLCFLGKFAACFG